MAITTMDDLVKYRDVINDFTIARIFEKASLFNSGVVVNTSAIVPQSGKTMAFPSWNTFNGGGEAPLSESTPLVPESVSTNNEVALINSRGHAIAASDLLNYVSGAGNIVETLSNQIGDYWARKLNATAIATLKGTTDAADAVDAGSVVLDGSASAIDYSMVYDALQLFGDNSDELTHIVMNSATFTELKKQNVIETVRPSEGGEFSTYLGRTVVVDNSLVPATTVHSSYLTRGGAIGYADGTYGRHIFEPERDALGGVDQGIFRRIFALHAAGMSYAGTVAADELGVSNTALATASNWALPYADSRQFGVIRLDHTL